MGRGRGQRLMSRMPASAPAAPAAQHQSSPSDIERALADLRAELTRALSTLSETPPETDWRRHRHELMKHVTPPLFAALEARDYELARGIGALALGLAGRPDEASGAQTASDDQMEAARLLAAAMPYLSEAAGRPDPEWYERDPMKRKDPRDDRYRMARGYERVVREMFEADWHEESVDLLERLRRNMIRDEAEQLRDWQPGDQPALISQTHETLDRALLAARGAIIDNAITGPVQASFDVGPEAFAEFCRRFGVQEVAPALSHDLSPVMIASFECQVAGQPLRLYCHHTLESDRRFNSVDGLARAQEFAREQGFAVAEELPYRDPRSVVSWRRRDKPGAQPPALKERREASVFGPINCKHPGASMRPVGPDMIVSCADCCQGVVARIPLHRIPPRLARLTSALDPKTYPAERRFWDVVHGREPGPQLSLKELRERDGLASMEPRDYATVSAEPVEAPAQPRSVAAAMNRR